MIKVQRIEKPVELTKEVQHQLTEEFKCNRKKSVWNKSYIRDNLLRESNNKCVYCECFIGEGHKEMHVDHFHFKDKYYDEVVEWDNLNPSCPHCNKKKSTHDTYENPIINPFVQNPKEYFYLKNYRYYSRNTDVEKIVRETIDVLGLNDTEDIVRFRFEQGEAIIDKIQDMYEFTKEHQEELSTVIKNKNRVYRGCKNILLKGARNAEYSAFIATIIKEDLYYQKLKTILTELGIWDEELQKLDDELEEIKMVTKPDIEK